MQEDALTISRDAVPQDTGKLVSLEVGGATVWILAPESVSQLDDDENQGIRAVAAPDPRELFAKTADSVKACVQELGTRIKEMAAEVQPSEVTIEFSISYEGSASGAIVPVFVTTQQKVATGFKVTAKWTAVEQMETE